MAEQAEWVGGPLDGQVRSIPEGDPYLLMYQVEGQPLTQVETASDAAPDAVCWHVPISRTKVKNRILWQGRTRA